MSTCRILSAVCLFFLECVTPLARANPVAQTRRAIAACYAQADAAFSRKDVNGFFAHTAPDYQAVGRDNRGEQRKYLLWQLVVEYRRFVPGATTASAKTQVKAFTLKGKKAIVRATERLVVVFASKRPGVPPSRITRSISTVDTWVNGPKGWVKRRSTILSSRDSMSNGRPRVSHRR